MSEKLPPACFRILHLLKEFQIDGRKPVIPSRKHVVAYMARYPDLSVEQAIKRLSWIGPFRSSDHPFLKGGIRFDPVPEFLIAVEFRAVGLVRDGDTQKVRQARYLESTDPLIPDPDCLEATLRELRIRGLIKVAKLYWPEFVEYERSDGKSVEVREGEEEGWIDLLVRDRLDLNPLCKREITLDSIRNGSWRGYSLISAGLQALDEQPGAEGGETQTPPGETALAESAKEHDVTKPAKPHAAEKQSSQRGFCASRQPNATEQAIIDHLFHIGATSLEAVKVMPRSKCPTGERIAKPAIGRECDGQFKATLGHMVDLGWLDNGRNHGLRGGYFLTLVGAELAKHNQKSGPGQD